MERYSEEAFPGAGGSYPAPLRRFIQAMGGELQIRAVFPEGEVEIEEFKDAAATSDSAQTEAA